MVKIMGPSEAYPLLGTKDVLFIDVREEGERREEHITPDIWMPLSALSWNPQLLDYSVLICYCAAGYRSQKVAEWIESQMASSISEESPLVFSLQDGLWGWKQNQLPMIKKNPHA